MHRIDGPGHVNGTFSEGNPAAGQRATKVTADWLNDLQANVIAVLTEGGVEPTKGRAADLLDAIGSIVEGIIGEGANDGGTGGGVPTARQLLTAGLATGGGDLTADRTITVPAATAAEVAAGEVDSKAITPAALAASISGNLANEGTTTLPGGLIIKWGGVRGNFSEQAVYRAFATAFPNACLRVAVTAVNASSSNIRDVWAQIVDYDRNGVTARLQYPGGGGSASSDGFDYIAFGR